MYYITIIYREPGNVRGIKVALYDDAEIYILEKFCITKNQIIAKYL